MRKETKTQTEIYIQIEEIAMWLHDIYEEAAEETGWQTQKSCKVEFPDLPEKNKETMRIVAEKILARFAVD